MNQNTDPPVFRGNILDLLLKTPPKKNNIFPIEIIDSPVVVDFCGFPIWKIENHLVGSSKSSSPRHTWGELNLPVQHMGIGNCHLGQRCCLDVKQSETARKQLSTKYRNQFDPQKKLGIVQSDILLTLDALE